VARRRPVPKGEDGFMRTTFLGRHMAGVQQPQLGVTPMGSEV
jgi:hypothetical protein